MKINIVNNYDKKVCTDNLTEGLWQCVEEPGLFILVDSMHNSTEYWTNNKLKHFYYISVLAGSAKGVYCEKMDSPVNWTKIRSATITIESP